MAVDKSYARLGGFLIVSLAMVLATAVFFVQRMKEREVIEAVTYSEGNVSGLEISSPVRFRGVEIGRVSDLRVEPRGSLIEIDFDVFVDRLTDIGANVERVKQEAATGVFERFRAQVVSNPVTGAAYLLIDMPVPPPLPMPLSFTPARAWVPAVPTMMATMGDRLPVLLERAGRALQAFETIMDRLPDSIERSDRFFTNVERIIQESQLPALSADSRAFFTSTSAQMEQITANLDKSLGPGGTLERFVDDTRASIVAADLATTTQSTRDAMNQTSLAADDLRRSLPAIRDSLAQLRDLARLLEEQPESMIFGAQPQSVKR
jgi:ABC-type transporter Mla subunit MlaD